MAAMRTGAVAVLLIARGVTAGHVNCTDGDPRWDGVMMAFGGLPEQCTSFDDWAALWSVDGTPSAASTSYLCGQTLVDVSDELAGYGVTWVVQDAYRDPVALTFAEVCPKACGVCTQTQPDHPPSPPRPPPTNPPTSPPPADCGTEMDTASLINTNGRGSLKQDGRLRIAEHKGGRGHRPLEAQRVRRGLGQLRHRAHHRQAFL